MRFAVMRYDSSAATSTCEAVVTIFAPRRTSWSQRRAHAYPGVSSSPRPLENRCNGRVRSSCEQRLLAATHPQQQRSWHPRETARRGVDARRVPSPQKQLAGDDTAIARLRGSKGRIESSKVSGGEEGRRGVSGEWGEGDIAASRPVSSDVRWNPNVWDARRFCRYMAIWR
jgi:hypothetical protein